ncbi:MAG TPA: hypothetical protein EYP82_00670 [Hydrogenothermaceae bacterium]|nr:hypothetical protein [Hydrogenothermaceae bacterium]
MSNTTYTQSPINGDEKIRAELTQKGIFNLTVSTALVDGEGVGADVGDPCVVYGPENSGGCVLSRRMMTKEGGASGMPYEIETLVFIGIQF